MTSLFLMDHKSNLIDLINHSQELIKELYELVVEIDTFNPIEAEKKIKYSKMVYKKLDEIPVKLAPYFESDPQIIELVFECCASVKPQLENAINDLEEKLKKGPDTSNSIEHEKVLSMDDVTKAMNEMLETIQQDAQEPPDYMIT